MINEPDPAGDTGSPSDDPRLVISIKTKPQSEDHKTQYEHQASSNAMWRIRSSVIAIFRRIVHRVRPFKDWLFKTNSNHVIAIASLVTAVATIAYVYYSRKQWEAISAQLAQLESGSAQTERLISETHSLATATKAQADSSKIIAENAKEATVAAKQQAIISGRVAKSAENALRLTEAADMGVDHTTCSTSGNALKLETEIVVFWKNTGRGTAIKVNAYLFSGFYGADIKAMDPHPSESMLGSGGIINSTPLVVRESIGLSDTIREQFLKSINDGTIKFHVWGWISYQDRFHINHLMVHDSAYMPKSNCAFVTVKMVSIPR